MTIAQVDAALGVSALRYGRDDHYDVVSAFIKSIRGSNPQAGLFWLARMLESGDDARFIARRLVILASEDIGMADPNALVVAVAAASALEHVGLPEAQLNLAQAVVYLATAPKATELRWQFGRPEKTFKEVSIVKYRRIFATDTTREQKSLVTVSVMFTHTMIRVDGLISSIFQTRARVHPSAKAITTNQQTMALSRQLPKE